MKFGPQNKDEASVFALEELRADVQYEIMRRMKQLGLTQAALAKKIGTSAAWVSQILDDDANLTLESISKVFLALESKCHISAFPIDANYHEALWDHVEIRAWNSFSEITSIGRLEAADVLSIAIESKRVGRAPIMQMPRSRLDRAAACLEAA